MLKKTNADKKILSYGFNVNYCSFSKDYETCLFFDKIWEKNGEKKIHAPVHISCNSFFLIIVKLPLSMRIPKERSQTGNCM